MFANNSGTIKNLKLDNVQITVQGSISSFIYAGSLVAKNTGIIENIETISGSLFAIARGGNIGYVGGLIGVHNRNITLDNLVNNANVNGENTTNMGGLIGRTNSITIINNSMNTGSISGLSNVGGLVGYGNIERINNSDNLGFIIGTNYVGGLFGFNNSSSFSLLNSINGGKIQGNNYVGGFGGNANSSLNTIENNINDGQIEGNSYIGGFFGHTGLFSPNGTLKLTNVINNGNITSTSQYTGGFVGWSNNSITVLSAINYGSINSTSSEIGGFFGRVQHTANTIDYSINFGNVTSSSSYVGGFVGLDNYTFTISKSFNGGDVSGSSNIGGVLGAGSVVVNDFWNFGSISGTSIVGGLVGNAYSVNINKSINSGTISGNSSLGGFVGEAILSTFVSIKGLYIYYSINFGQIIATNSSNIGGITGSLSTTNDIEQTYYSGSVTSNGVEVAGTNFGTKVTDLSTFNPEFFTTTLEWDTEIWDFTGLDIANGVYPTLKNMPVVEE